MPLNADDYRRGALERIGAARQLHDRGRFASAICLGGIAVECILRAYRCRVNPEFDARHDLHVLFTTSGFLDTVPDGQRRRLTAAVGDVWARWRNDYRYADDVAVLRDLRARRLTVGIRGDQLKENSRIVMESAHVIVGSGVGRW